MSLYRVKIYYSKNVGHEFLGPVKCNLENFIRIDLTTRYSIPVRVVGIANLNIISVLLLNWIGFGKNIDSTWS